MRPCKSCKHQVHVACTVQVPYRVEMICKVCAPKPRLSPPPTKKQVRRRFNPQLKLAAHGCISSANKQELVYTRTMRAGRSHLAFLGLQDLQAGAAVAIVAAYKHVMLRAGLLRRTLVVSCLSSRAGAPAHNVCFSSV